MKYVLLNNLKFGRFGNMNRPDILAGVYEINHNFDFNEMICVTNIETKESMCIDDQTFNEEFLPEQIYNSKIGKLLYG